MSDTNDIRTNFNHPASNDGQFTWSTTETFKPVPEPITYDSDPMFLVENGAEKYLYDDIITALKAMVEYDSIIEVYQYDKTNNRFSHYIDLAQTEE